jgi:hypothetical protein
MTTTADSSTPENQDGPELVYPEKWRTDKIDARYGEDFADAMYMAAMLYLNPDIEESPDEFPWADFDKEDNWNLLRFHMAIFHNDPKRAQELADALRVVEKASQEVRNVL